MRSLAARTLALSSLLAAPAFAASTEMYTPALPANDSQFNECRVVNVTGAPQTVTTEAFDSTGATSGGPYTQTLAPGEAGGFSLSGIYASMYCKFTVPGKASGYRVSIDVLDVGTGGAPNKIAVSLPGT
jgi:hypothetical protein